MDGELEGYPWLPRMLAKARATLARTASGFAVEDELQEQGTYLRVRHRDALPEQHGGNVFSGAEHGAGVSVVLIDAPPGEAVEWHCHPVEEVVAVHDGQATFFLGELQRRIVRAGEVVRIPARVPHRYANTGDRQFVAVAAHGSSEIVTHAVA